MSDGETERIKTSLFGWVIMILMNVKADKTSVPIVVKFSKIRGLTKKYSKYKSIRTFICIL